LSRKRARGPVPSALWGFLGYFIVLALNVFVVEEEYFEEFVMGCFTVAQLGFLLWICTDLLKDPRLTRSVLLSFSSASVCVALGNLLRVPGFYQEYGGGRITAMGDNPNAVAANMAIAIVALVGVFLHDRQRRSLRKYLLLGSTLPLLAVLVSTASRGGVMAFLAGSLAYLLPSKRLGLSLILGSLVLAIAVYEISEDPEFVERWRVSYYEGNFAGREDIYSRALIMISERPMFGWQPARWAYELGRREGLRTPRDAHDLWLGLLLEVGLIGTIPFAIGVVLCVRAAWKARRGSLGPIPLALLLTVIFMGLSNGTLSWKSQWLVCGLVLAASANVPESSRRFGNAMGRIGLPTPSHSR